MRVLSRYLSIYIYIYIYISIYIYEEVLRMNRTCSSKRSSITTVFHMILLQGRMVKMMANPILYARINCFLLFLRITVNTSISFSHNHLIVILKIIDIFEEPHCSSCLLSLPISFMFVSLKNNDEQQGEVFWFSVPLLSSLQVLYLYNCMKNHKEH